MKNIQLLANLFAAALALVLPTISTAQDINSTQVWSGDLIAGGAKLRILFSAEKDKDGQWTGDMFSPDQTEEAFPAKEIVIGNGKLSFSVPSLGSMFAGDLNEAGDEVSGEWAQSGLKFPMQMKSIGKMPTKKMIEVWQGTLKAGPQEFEFQLRIFDVSDEGQTGVLDSFSESVAGLPLELERNGDQFNFTLPATKATYEGILTESGRSIEGTWTQAGQDFDLDFSRVELEQMRSLELQRPQTPKPPFKWKPVDLTIPTTDRDGKEIELSGTLSLPPDVAKPPVVILMSGSGPQDRDETIYEHRPFLVIADYLASRGIATFRYDDRGVGKSTGDFGAATSEDFASDAIAVVNFLKLRDDVDIARIALMGHSEGGLIAPIIANSNDSVHSIVLLAGPSVDGKEILSSQSRRIMEVAGMDRKFLEFQDEVSNRMIDLVLSDSDGDPEFRAKLLEDWEKLIQMSADAAGGVELPPTDLDMALSVFKSPWMKYFLGYDPSLELQKLKVPVLAVFCENDLQVLPSVNELPMRKCLETAPTDDFEVIVFPGLNHLFQHSETGAPADYVAIEETFSVEALETIGDWLAKHFAK